MLSTDVIFEGVITALSRKPLGAETNDELREEAAAALGRLSYLERAFFHGVYLQDQVLLRYVAHTLRSTFTHDTVYTALKEFARAEPGLRYQATTPRALRLVIEAMDEKVRGGIAAYFNRQRGGVA